ncbi:hypothetical protein [Chryseobacterium sp. FH2]|uniref:hypothetical protein n=1 Tax=Chryseobacterium sp. FH2 TaxID=1674291 RepID=UPI00065AB446|nr:hypothetical protein [Chryseobacterium sp. FH2]
MKNKFMIASYLLVSGILFSQVGINNQKPQGIFHVDGAKDNPATVAPNATQQLNDFVVDASGKVGIGTTTPSQKLEINTGGTTSAPITGFKLSDGNQKTDYVLTADTNGVGTWRPASIGLAQGVITSIPDSSGDVPFQSTLTYTVRPGTYITLAPGRWKVDITQLLRYNGTEPFLADDWIWVRFSLGDSPTVPAISSDLPPAAGRLVSMGFQGPCPAAPTGVQAKYNIGSGSLYVNNTSGANKTYYLLVGNIAVIGTPSNNKTFSAVGGNWGENTITAVRIQQ